MPVPPSTTPMRSCRVDATTICGTDPAHPQGRRRRGHRRTDPRSRGGGTVESVGAGVKNIDVGDRVLVSCITACGRAGIAGTAATASASAAAVGSSAQDRRHPGGVRARTLRRQARTYVVPGGASATRQLLMLADIPRPATRSACSRATCGPGTSSPSSAPARSGSPPIDERPAVQPGPVVAFDRADSRRSGEAVRWRRQRSTTAERTPSADRPGARPTASGADVAIDGGPGTRATDPRLSCRLATTRGLLGNVGGHRQARTCTRGACDARCRHTTGVSTPTGRRRAASWPRADDLRPVRSWASGSTSTGSRARRCSPAGELVVLTAWCSPRCPVDPLSRRQRRVSPMGSRRSRGWRRRSRPRWSRPGHPAPGLNRPTSGVPGRAGGALVGGVGVARVHPRASIEAWIMSLDPAPRPARRRS